jgi:hypothetical protein
VLKFVPKDQAYRPNFANKRVQDKLSKVLAWCHEKLSTNAGVPVHHDVLKQVFGSSEKDLSKYLRDRLLLREGSYKPGVASFKYRLNQDGLDALAARCAGSMVTTSLSEFDRLKDRYGAQLASGVFEYHRSSERDWHGLQILPNARKPGYTGPIKSEFWRSFGYAWNYDMVAAAPTILSQLAKSAGMPDLALAAITEYLDDRKGFRRHVQALLGIPSADAKKIVTGLFNGARLTPHHTCGVYQKLGYDRDKLELFVNDPEVKRLRGAIKIMWRRLDAKFGDSLKAAGQKKWSLYFACERKVMDATAKFLRERGIKFFAEHDGFRANREIDVEELAREVEIKTKFKIEFEQSA